MLRTAFTALAINTVQFVLPEILDRGRLEEIPGEEAMGRTTKSGISWVAARGFFAILAAFGTDPWQESFSALPKALEQFDQHRPFLGAQGFSDVFHNRRMLLKGFPDQFLTCSSEADDTVSAIGRMWVTPD
jgi:hypothetical protein